MIKDVITLLIVTLNPQREPYLLSFVQSVQSSSSKSDTLCYRLQCNCILFSKLPSCWKIQTELHFLPLDF